MKKIAIFSVLLSVFCSTNVLALDNNKVHLHKQIEGLQDNVVFESGGTTTRRRPPSN